MVCYEHHPIYLMFKWTFLGLFWAVVGMVALFYVIAGLVIVGFRFVSEYRKVHRTA